MKSNKELNQQVLNTAVDKKGRPTINIDERKSIYNSISEALKAIPITNRNVGLTIPIYNGIKIVEYWWEKGIKDSDFVKKINGDDIPRIDAKLVDLQNQIDGINNIEFKIFDSLPELGDSSIIYVIPNTTSQEDDNFIEYFWIKSQQRYERFGGLNVDGGVTINNFYTFDNNVFTIDEESNFKNVSLNSKKIGIGDKSIEIYKYDIGKENNERRVLINTYSRVAQNRIYDGGEIKLNGFIKVGGNIQKEIECQLYPDGLNIICTQDEIVNKALLIPQSLTIEQDINKSVISYNGIYLIEDENNIFEVSKTQLYTNSGEIKLYSSTSFDIHNNENFGIKGYIENETDKIKLYTSNTNIVLTNNNINLNVGGANIILTENDINLNIGGINNINLNYQDINLTFSRLIYLNSPTTKVKKVLFEQSNNLDIYLESYDSDHYGVTYHGLKSSSDIYLFGNSYIIKPVEGYELTSYKLNSIKYRVSSNPKGLGDNIISWSTVNSYPVLNVGKDNDICIENDKITITKTNCTIQIDDNNNIIRLYNSNNKIIINPDNIKFKLGNLFITMTSDGISDGTNTKTWAQLLS